MRLIDGDALMNSIEPIIEAEEQIYGRASWRFATKCRSAIEDAPTIEPKRKAGRWMPLQLPMAYPPYQCDCCFGNAPMVETGKLMNRHLEALLTDFCPNCGADMRGKNDETD